MKFTIWSLVLLLLLFSQGGADQSKSPSFGPNLLVNNPAITIYSADDEGIPIFVEGELSEPVARGDEAAAAIAFFEANRGAYKIAEPSEELVVKRTEEDNLGMKHIRFDQYHRGLKVIGGELIAHFNSSGRLATVNGHYLAGLEVDPEPVYGDSRAIEIATVDLESFFGKGEPDSPELVILPWEKQNHLCWRLFLYSDTPMGRWEYFIDAHTGEVVFKANRIMNANDIGIGIGVMGDTLYHVDTDYNGSVYRMIDYTRQLNNNPHGHNGQMPDGNYIQTNVASSSLPGNVATDPDNYWYSSSQGSAVSGHIYTAAVYDWMLREFNRNSYTNNGTSMLTSVDYSAEGDNNAYWNGSQIVIWSYSSGWRSLAGCPDVIAHEWGHAVTEYTSGLIYQKEQGALNEAFSDMIGSAFEFAHDTLDPPDWYMGENGEIGGTGFRNMENPHEFGDPDYYGTSDPYWIDVEGCTPGWWNDYCGVHTNCGVGNKWFFLLSDGGTHHGVTVTGIGVENAMAIAYRANAYYWNSQTDYHEGALGTISAATDLDPTGAWTNQVANAWNAVGVSTPGPTLNFTYPSGIPEILAPGSPTTFPVIVSGLLGGSPVQGTGQLHYTLNGGPLQTVSMTETSPNEYEATLPDLLCGDVLEFYVSAEENSTGRHYDPDPAIPHTAIPATGQVTIFEDDFKTDLGWTISGGLWARGVPTGGGGEYGGPDPTGGCVGTNVYGYNLSGDYENYLTERHLTSPAIDCTDLYKVKLKFWRWLGVEQPQYDHAYIRVSNNGTSWTTIWENDVEITDDAWVELEYDISSVADNQSTVYIRWTMGETDGGWRYCGWNIDGVGVTGYECNTNSPIITSEDVPDWTVGQAYSEQLEAVGGVGQLTWSDKHGDLGGTGLTLSSAGVLSGMPNVTGPLTFTAAVIDEDIQEDEKVFDFTINAAVIITTDDLPDWTQGLPFSRQLAATGGTGDKTWSDKDGDLDGTGLTLSTEGLLSGTPTGTGSIDFTALVADITGDDDEKPFSFEINPEITITTDMLPDGTKDSPYSEQLTATGGTGTLVWSDKNDDLASTGLTLSSDGLVSGTPLNEETISFTAVATDSVGADDETVYSFDINIALTIVTEELPDWTFGGDYSVLLEAVGGIGTLTWSDKNGDLPGTGLTLSTDGLLSGTPLDTGVISFTALVTDESKQTDEIPFSFTINPALEVTTTSIPDWTAGNPYMQMLVCNGGTGEIVWTDKNNDLSGTGLSLSSQGLLSGTPTTPGLIEFTAEITDDGGGSDEQPLSFTVNAAVTIMTTTPPEVTVDRPYTHQLEAIGGTGSLTWTDKNGDLDGTGLTLSTSGQISGIPTSPGTIDFTALVADEIGADDEDLVEIVVNDHLEIMTESVPDWTVAIPYARQLISTGGTGEITWTDRHDDLAGSGLTISATGLLSGTPALTGPMSFIAEATDESGAVDSIVLAFTVNESVAIVTETLPDGTAEEGYSAQIDATGGTGEIAWVDKYDDLAGTGLTLASDGTLSGTPMNPGLFSFTASAEDICGCFDDKVFDIDIAPAFMCGDVDDNELINILDITFIIDFLYKGGPTPEPLESGDVNSSGEMDILDVTYLINYLYYDGPEPTCL